MATHQLPKISNHDTFEDLVCDLFNEIENTNTFKRFGKNGHNQKGIDIFSSEKDIVIQCKKKDINRKDILLRKELFTDIESDINNIIFGELKINFKTIYFVSTYQDHPDIDEYCESIKDEKKISFEVVYWGWDTLQNRILNYTSLLSKYYPDFILSTTTKEEVLNRNLELKRRIDKDFSDWLDYLPENRKRNSRMILRAFDGNQYPNSNEPDEYGEYSWFAASIKSINHNGLEFILCKIESLVIYEDDKWDFAENANDKNLETIPVYRVGRINFSDIVNYDLKGDEHYPCPHFFCKFTHKGLPFEEFYFIDVDEKPPCYFEFKDKKP